MTIVHELRREDGTMLAFLTERPSYCDRGRWLQSINIGIWRSDIDPPGRYYFDLDAGKAETIAYLIAKKIDVSGAIWKEAVYL